MVRSPARKAKPLPPPALLKFSVYAGSVHFGFVLERGRERTALDKTGKHIGVFASRKAAADAVAEAAARG